MIEDGTFSQSPELSEITDNTAMCGQYKNQDINVRGDARNINDPSEDLQLSGIDMASTKEERDTASQLQIEPSSSSMTSSSNPSAFAAKHSHLTRQ